MPEQAIMLKVLLRERHWQHYAAFCAEYDKAAQRLDASLPGAIPAGPNCTAGYQDPCAACPTPITAACWRKCSPATPRSSCSARDRDPIFANGQAQGATARPGAHAGLPVFAAPSIGIRPFIERAFDREHVTIDFAGFSGETLHGVTQEPLDMIRMGQGKPQSPSGSCCPTPPGPWCCPAAPMTWPTTRTTATAPTPHHPARPRHRRQRPGTHRAWA